MTIRMSMGLRRGTVITVAALAGFSLVATSAQAAPRQSAAMTAPPVTTPTLISPADANPPAPEPASARGNRRLAAPPCVMPDEGTVSCLEVGPPELLPAPPRRTGSGPSTADVPSWCFHVPPGEVNGNRFEACLVVPVRLRLYVVRRGQRTPTGELGIRVIGVADTLGDVEFYDHDLNAESVDGWGDALLGTTIRATPARSGACNITFSGFPIQPIVPVGAKAFGTMELTTTATAVGAVGKCTSSWSVSVDTPGYPASGSLLIPMTSFRCDNATGGNNNVGCVVPWYPAAVEYRASQAPHLIMHVSQAQGSGLPGGSIDRPLTRLTDPILNELNRLRACGDAPSIPDKSCDEYPPASSWQGAYTGGGTRRTFDNCHFDLPRETGPVGTSVCMIPAHENNVQGGWHTQFFRHNRVLGGDPWRVVFVI